MYADVESRALSGAMNKMIDDAPLMAMYKRLSESYNRLLDMANTMDSTLGRLVGDMPQADNATTQGSTPVPYGGQYAEVESAVRNIERAVSVIESLAIRVNKLG